MSKNVLIYRKEIYYYQEAGYFHVDIYLVLAIF